jgi:hypothetical protein
LTKGDSGFNVLSLTTSSLRPALAVAGSGLAPAKGETRLTAECETPEFQSLGYVPAMCAYSHYGFAMFENV